MVRRAWLIWGLAVTAYVVAVFQRASLGVAGVEAQARFGASAAELSLFSVLQLIVYAGLQIPVGLLLDRFGSRRLLVTGGVVMAVGQLVLAETTSVGLAVCGRVLVGAGDALTFISVLRIVTLWFAPERAGLVTQLTGTLGQFGQIVAAYPLVALLRDAGWTPTFAGAGFVSLAVAVAVLVVIRDAPPGVVVPRSRPTLTTLRTAWAEPGTRLGLWTHFVTQFSGMVFALLWGYPFLVQEQDRSPAEAGVLLTVLVVVGMVFGPLLGQLAGRWPYRRSVPVLAIVGGSALMWTVVLAWPGNAPLGLLVVLVVVLASNGPGSIMGFDYARTENDAARVGSAVGIVNVGGFTASLCTIALIGIVLDATGDNYRVAFCVQYPFWAVGLFGVLRSRRALRTARGIELDSFPAAVRRVSRRAPRGGPPGPSG